VYGAAIGKEGEQIGLNIYPLSASQGKSSVKKCWLKLMKLLLYVAGTVLIVLFSCPVAFWTAPMSLPT
jgi:hypothetical protein